MKSVRKNFIDITGKKFGMLRTIEYIGGHHCYWKCVCDCGKITKASGGNLRSGKVVSCGCYFKTMPSRIKHGFLIGNFHEKDRKYIRFYGIYKGIRQRCNDKNYDAYNKYGGKGIKCYWDDFKQFKEDMYEGYLEHEKKFGEKDTTIDRIDGTKGYFKDNCRWATRKEQANNVSSNVYYEDVDGEKRSLEYLSLKYGVKRSLLNDRIRSRGNVADAINFNRKTTVYNKYIDKDFVLNNLDNIYKVLDGREVDIITSRCGATDGREQSLEEIGKRLNITRERVRQIEKNITKKLSACV